jgi:tetratricopeptide (TPR) repeat protein
MFEFDTRFIHKTTKYCCIFAENSFRINYSNKNMKFSHTVLLILMSFILCNCGEKADVEAYQFFIKANQKLKEKEYDQAIRLFGEAIDKKKDYSDAFNNRGIAYQKKQILDKALSDFNDAIKFDPKFWEAYYNRAETNFLVGNGKEALPDLEFITKTYQDSSYFHVLVGDVKNLTGDASGAISSYEKALLLNPKNAEAYVNHGTIYYEDKKYEVAKKDFLQALKINPNQDFAANNMGLILLKEGKLKESLVFVEKALSKNPANPIYLNNKGLVLLKMNQDAEAIQLIERSLRLNADNAYALRNKGLYLKKVGKLDEAKKYFDDAQKINPSIELE